MTLDEDFELDEELNWGIDTSLWLFPPKRASPGPDQMLHCQVGPQGSWSPRDFHRSHCRELDSFMGV